MCKSINVESLPSEANVLFKNETNKHIGWNKNVFSKIARKEIITDIRYEGLTYILCFEDERIFVITGTAITGSKTVIVTDLINEKESTYLCKSTFTHTLILLNNIISKID